MEEKMENIPIRGYHRLSKPCYGNHTEQSECPEIKVGMYYPAGGCAGEMSVTWEHLDNRMIPQLKIYDSAWRFLVDFKALLKDMAKCENKNITEEQFAKLLDSVI